MRGAVPHINWQRAGGSRARTVVGCLLRSAGPLPGLVGPLQAPQPACYRPFARRTYTVGSLSSAGSSTVCQPSSELDASQARSR